MDTVTVSSNQYNTVSPIELNAQASVPSWKFSPRREKNCDGGIAMAELWDNRRRDGEFAEGIRGRGGKGTQQTGLRNIPPLVLQSMSEPKMEGSARRRKEMGKGRWSLGWMVGGAGCVVSSIHPSTAPPDSFMENFGENRPRQGGRDRGKRKGGQEGKDLKGAGQGGDKGNEEEERKRAVVRCMSDRPNGQIGSSYRLGTQRGGA